MPQLHCYLPEHEAEALRHRAERAGLSVSRYLAELARKDLVGDWPEGYFQQLFERADIAPIALSAPATFEDRAALE